MNEERIPQSDTLPLVYEGIRPDDVFTANQQYVLGPNPYPDLTNQQYPERPQGYMLPRSLAPGQTVDSANSGFVYYGYPEARPRYEDTYQNTRSVVGNKKKLTKYVQHFSGDEEPEEISKSRSRTNSKFIELCAYFKTQRKVFLGIFAILILLIVALLGVIVEL